MNNVKISRDEISALKRSVDLLSLIEMDTTLKRVANTNGGEWCGPCPMSGCDRKTDGFRVQPNNPDGGIWLCRGCTQGKWKDVIDYVRMLRGLNFLQACEWLANKKCATPTEISDSVIKTKIIRNNPVPQEWQDAAREVISFGEKALWSAGGRRVLEHLRQKRCLNDETIRHFRLGYVPKDKNIIFKNGKGHNSFLKVHQGILIPCVIDDVVWYLKVRKLQGNPRYLHIKGSRPALFGAQNLLPHVTALLTEGEFDAILAYQLVGDLVGLGTLGSATSKLNISQWGKYLMHLRSIFLAYDVDQVGLQAANELSKCSPQIAKIRVPRLRPTDKDITDYVLAGGNLRSWLQYHIEKKEIKKVCIEANPIITRVSEIYELDLNSHLDEPWRIDPEKPCYACGQKKYQAYPDGRGYFCTICHPPFA